MNAVVDTAEENSTVAKVGEYMRAGDDDPDIRVIVLTGASAVVFVPGPISDPARRRAVSTGSSAARGWDYGGFPSESPVRTGLAAGGRWIRTLGPPL
jgi:hypothetical protein